MQGPRTVRDDFGRIIRKVGVNRNLHTLKYDTLFRDFDPDRKPIINLPLPDPSDESYAAKMREMEANYIGIVALTIILPFISIKYPDLSAKVVALGSFFKAVSRLIKPTFDDRWDRSMAEWEKIVTYAKVHGYNAASRKFSAIKDGNEKYLSPNYIKKKAKVIDKLNSSLSNGKNVKMYAEYFTEVREALKNDKELLKITKRIFRKYINKIVDEEFNRYETYSYDYYYIRHYDSGRNKKLKSDFEKGEIKKTQMNGKIECGPFKREDLPSGSVPENTQSIDAFSKMIFEVLINVTEFKKGHRKR